MLTRVLMQQMLHRVTATTLAAVAEVASVTRRALFHARLAGCGRRGSARARSRSREVRGTAELFRQ